MNKFEARNRKLETISNAQNINLFFLKFEHLNFGFV